MGSVVARQHFEDVRSSPRADGGCWCGSEPTGRMQVFAAPVALKRTPAGQITEGDRGVDSDVLYDSGTNVSYRGRDVLVCGSGHLYSTRSPKYVQSRRT